MSRSAILVYALLFLLISLFATASCQSKTGKKKAYTLRVAVLNDEDFYTDSIYISSTYRRNPDSPEFPVIEYDDFDSKKYFRFDSIISGSLTIYCQSKLNYLFEKKIALTSDSTIYIRKDELPVFKKTSIDSLDFTTLQPGEKTSISTTISGCFQYYTEKMIILKQPNNWQITFTSNNWDGLNKGYSTKKFVLNNNFSDSLHQFKNSLTNFLRLNQFGGCTTSLEYIIQKDDRFAIINDATCSDFIRYDSLLKLINPERFDSKEQVQ